MHRCLDRATLARAVHPLLMPSEIDAVMRRRDAGGGQAGQVMHTTWGAAIPGSSVEGLRHEAMLLKLLGQSAFTFPMLTPCLLACTPAVLAYFDQLVATRGYDKVVIEPPEDSGFR
jgi:hypothetical protein